MSETSEPPLDKGKRPVEPMDDDLAMVYMMKYTTLWFSRRFYKKKSLNDLNHAVSVAHKLVTITSDDNPNRLNILVDLNSLATLRFNLTRSAEDMNHLVTVAGLKVLATPEDHPSRLALLNDHATLLGQRFDMLGSVQDLHEAVKVGRSAIETAPDDLSDLAAALNNHAKSLGKRANALGSSDDLERALEVIGTALDLVPPSHPDRAGLEHTRSVLLSRRSMHSRSLEQIDANIQMAERTAMAISGKSTHRALYASNLARLLLGRFELTGSMEDLNRAILLLEETANITPEHDPSRAATIGSLSIALGLRFQQTESIDDINRAIEMGYKLIESTSPTDPHYARHLGNLGNLAGPRYERTGLKADLDFAIKIFERAIQCPQYNQLDKAKFLMSSGTWLGNRWEHTGDAEDINRAIERCQQAVDNTPPEDGVSLAMHLDTLGTWLHTRFEWKGDRVDIDRAIDAITTATDLVPPNHIYRPSHLFSRADTLFARAHKYESLEDLDEAIRLGRESLDLVDEEHAHRASYLYMLGNYFRRRSEMTKSADDVDNALSYYSEGICCEAATPTYRIASARHAAIILADQERWDEACAILSVAVELLPHISPRLLDNSDKQHQVIFFSDVASLAGAVSLNAGNDVFDSLRLLEAGRGLIAGSLLELRTDLSELRDKHPDLAARFEFLRDKLDSRQSVNGPQLDSVLLERPQGSQLAEANEELANLIVGIRDYDEFETFLLPPTREDFMAAAKDGPVVVININSYRCDAFIIEQHDIRVLPLPRLSESMIKEKLKATTNVQRVQSLQSADTLKWLWDDIVKPIFTALGYLDAPSNDVWPRVWWIPTGVLSNFPIHAAGVHVKGSSTSALDRVISSYSPSVKSLISARHQRVNRPSAPDSGKALLVAMPTTSGQNPLANATREVEMLTALCPSLQLEAVIPSQRRKAEILKELRGCQVFHFAGHGDSKASDPAKSLLLLDDWEDNPLTVGDLRDMNMHERGPFLGFLSACSTSANKVDPLTDEGIHLAGSLQLAGFRHVIGTLWEVNDSHCVDVARAVYETLRDEGMTDLAVCRGLHKALRKLRDESLNPEQRGRDVELRVRKPTLQTFWVPYVHFGV